MRKVLLVVIVLVLASLGFILIKGRKGFVSPTTTGGIINQVKEAVTGPSATSQNVASGLSLTVSTPQDGTTVSTPSVVVSGKTSPGAEISVNDMEATADPSGSFTLTISLDEGGNDITVSANDSEGNYAQKTLTVTYEPPQ